MAWIQIACFGDSIVHGGLDPENGGWVNLLRCHFAARELGDHVFNLGLGGDSSRDVRKRFADDLRGRLGHVDHVLFSCGTNDVIYEPHRTSEDEYRDNLRALVVQARELGKRPILCTVTPWDPARWGGISAADLARRERSNAFVRELCQRESIACIDLAGALALGDLVDGVHPGPAGHRKLFRAVLAGLIAVGIAPASAA